MRIRSIKPEFWESESLGRVSREARLLFIGLFSCCDDVGRARASSRLLASRLFPYDDDAFKKLPAWIAELERQGCIRLYQVAGESYLDIPKWLNHQKIDKPSASKLPSFDDSREDSRGFEKNSLGTGNREEEQGKEGDSCAQPNPDPEADSLRSRINKWFRRREGTEWQASELKALKLVVKLKTPESDLQLLDARYETKNKYRRKDILTLLNNWNTEIDRCKSGDDDAEEEGQPKSKTLSLNIEDYQ
jgi:hypothetical protein